MNPLPGRGLRRWCLALAVAVLAPAALAQVPPSAAEVAAYRGLLAKAHRGDVPGLEQAIAAGAPLPALGEGSVCEFCAVRGLCRKDYWADAEQAMPAPETP